MYSAVVAVESNLSLPGQVVELSSHQMMQSRGIVEEELLGHTQTCPVTSMLNPETGVSTVVGKESPAHFYGTWHLSAGRCFLHAVVLVTSLVASSLSLSSTAWDWALVAMYSASLVGMALVAVSQLRYAVQVSPLFLSGMHLVLVVLETQQRLASDLPPSTAWERGWLQLALLQGSAMLLFPASPGWLLGTVVSVAALAVIMVSSMALSAREEVQSLLLPSCMMLSTTALMSAETPEPMEWDWRRRLRSALWQGVTWQRPSSQAVIIKEAMAELVQGNRHSLAERLEATCARLDQAGLPADSRAVLKKVFRRLAREARVLMHQYEPLEGLPYQGASPEVQDFVMELLPAVSPRHRSKSKDRHQLAFTTSAKTYEAHVQHLLEPLMYLESAPEKVEEMRRVSDLGNWAMDLLSLARGADRPLRLVGQAALEPLFQHFEADKQPLETFLTCLERRYRSTNPYHNSAHAADVLNSMVYFLNLPHRGLETLQPLERLAALTAAAAHDVGHDGRNNRFHMVAGTPVALLFNDQSCLENLHCSITFALLESEGSNFLQHFAAVDRVQFRGIVVPMILDTDLGKHFQSLVNFRKDFLDSSPDLESSRIRQQLLSILLKACDVGGSAKPFALHVQWTTRVNEEFYRQGDAEKELGLAPSPFCDRRSGNITDSQKGFYDFIVSPLYIALNEHLQSRRVAEEVLEEVEKNARFWRNYNPLHFNYDHPLENVKGLVKQFNVMYADQRPPRTQTASENRTNHSRGPGRRQPGRVLVMPRIRTTPAELR